MEASELEQLLVDRLTSTGQFDAVRTFSDRGFGPSRPGVQAVEQDGSAHYVQFLGYGRPVQ